MMASTCFVGAQPVHADAPASIPVGDVVYIERVLPPQQTQCGATYLTRLVAANASTGSNRRVLVTNTQGCNPYSTLDLNPQRTTIATTIGGALFLYDIAAVLSGNTTPRIFTQRAFCQAPSWNTDGTRIACRGAESLLIVDPLSLQLVTEIRTEPLGIIVGDADWLPDGDLVVGGNSATLSCPAPGTTTRPGGVWRFHLVSNQVQSITPILPATCQAAWAGPLGIKVSPSGTSFAFASFVALSGFAFGASLWVAATDGSNPHVVAPATADTGFGRLAWSPSGRYLLGDAYQRADGTPLGLLGQINAFDVNTGHTRTLIMSDATADVSSPSSAEPADTTAPAVVGSPDRPADRNGWYNRPTTITWTATDPDDPSEALSLPPPTIAQTEGAGVTYESGPACDPAGNCAVGQYTLSLDATPPTMAASPSTTANANGWYREPVTVTFTCADALSGVLTCPTPMTTGAEGATQPASGTAMDVAGNTATAAIEVSIDTTPPTITTSVAQAPNPQGWNDGAVTVTFTCADALSGVANCPAPVTVEDEGDNHIVNGSSTDLAGNTSTISVAVSIDRTGPLITATRSPANAYGWNNAPVTITFTCADTRSGVASCPQPIVVSDEGQDQSASGTAVDNAGNSTTATVAGINIDRTDPHIASTVTGTRGATGWYTTPPAIQFACTDSLSGIAECPADANVTSEGANQTIVGNVTDKAGNTATTAATDLDVDLTPPTVDITGAVHGTTYPFEQLPTVACTTTDSVSGVAASATPTVSRDATGLYTAACSGATDVAGNVAPTRSITYRITQTAAALTTLTSQYLSTSTAPNAHGIAHDLANKLRNGQICAYITKVRAEAQGTHPAFTTAQAAELEYWARLLDPTC
jgi:hypothetical protein